jgi:hypothetical protein
MLFLVTAIRKLPNAAQTNNIVLYYITTREPEDFNKIDPLNPNYTAGNNEYQF